MQTVDDARYRSRKSNARIRNSEAHRVAYPDLCCHAFLCRHVLDGADERNYEAVEVRSRYVLEMAARCDAGLERIVHDRQIVIYRLLARHAELIEYVVVGAAGKDSGLLYAHLLDDLEVFLLCSDPRCDLRELESEILACPDGSLVSVRICEELGLSDYSLRTRELRHHFEDVNDLLGRIRLP